MSIFKLLLDLVHVVFGDDKIFSHAIHVAAGKLGGAGRIAEIAADGVLYFLAAAQ
jgi:hypothetical protein